MSRENLGLVLGFVGVCIFAGTLPFTHIAVEHLSPLFVTAGRRLPASWPSRHSSFCADPGPHGGRSAPWRSRLYAWSEAFPDLLHWRCSAFRRPMAVWCSAFCRSQPPPSAH